MQSVDVTKDIIEFLSNNFRGVSKTKTGLKMGGFALGLSVSVQKKYSHLFAGLGFVREKSPLEEKVINPLVSSIIVAVLDALREGKKLKLKRATLTIEVAGKHITYVLRVKNTELVCDMSVEAGIRTTVKSPDVKEDKTLLPVLLKMKLVIDDALWGAGKYLVERAGS